MYFDLCIKCPGSVTHEILFKCNNDLDQIAMVHDNNSKTLLRICSALADQASSGVMDATLQFHKLSPLVAQRPEDRHIHGCGNLHL